MFIARLSSKFTVAVNYVIEGLHVPLEHFGDVYVSDLRNVFYCVVGFLLQGLEFPDKIVIYSLRVFPGGYSSPGFPEYFVAGRKIVVEMRLQVLTRDILPRFGIRNRLLGNLRRRFGDRFGLLHGSRRA